MALLPHFQFYVSDWLGSRKILLMTDAQKGIYITLLAHQWSDPSCSIPTNKKILQKMLPGSKWSNIEYVLKECFVVEGTHEERARNERLKCEHSKAISKREKAIEAGKVSGILRKQRTDAQRTLIGRSADGELYQIPESELEKEESKHRGKSQKSRFTPPTLNEVKNYCIERKNKVDPEAFISFYESKGWMIGKNKMKSWEAAIHTWEKNRNGKPERSFHDRVVEQNEKAKHGARVLLGVSGRGGRLGNSTDQDSANRKGDGAIPGEFEHVSEMETLRD